MPDHRTDQELVGAAREGDMRAFAELYRRYRDWAVRLAYRFTGDESDALDVLQEAFAYLLGKLPTLTLTAKMTTFLYPAVKHLSIAANRKRRRTTAADGALPDTAAFAIDAGAATEAREHLALIIAALPVPQREVLLMRFVDDMSMGEIAAALQIPEGTVKSRLHHALRTLAADPRTTSYFGPSP